MDKQVQAFLESGQLELYILGNLSKEENQLVEQWIARSPEVREAYENLQDSLEIMAQSQAVQPPANTKQRILQEIQENTAQKTRSWNIPTAWILAGLLGVASFYLFFKQHQLQKNLKDTKAAYAQLEKDCADQQTQVNQLYAERSQLLKVNTTRVALKGNNKAPDFEAVFFCDPSKSTILYTAQLPTLPANQCYQLWGDKDGKMISLAVLSDNQTPNLQQINYDPAMVSLNVTIEERLENGAQDHPNVEQLVASQVI